MSDTFNRIFTWQIGIAVVVAAVWAILWELDTDERGFFYDFPWGMFLGFFFGLIVLLVVGLLAVGIWALVRQVQGPEGSLSDAMFADVDRLSGSSYMENVNNTLDTWNASGIAWGIAWGVGLAFLWGITGGFVLRYDNFGIAIIVVLVMSAGGALAITGLFRVTDVLSGALGGGYSWLDGTLTTMRTTWDSWGLPARVGIEDFTTWGFAGAFAWAIIAFLASGGMGAGIVQAIVLALIAFIAAVAAGIAGVQLRRSMDTP